MNSSFEQALIEVWRQTFVENATVVVLGTERYAVRQTPKRHLREVDFVIEGENIRGLEQNPDTKSPWAQMARSGSKVMQFLSEGRYVANVVDGEGDAVRKAGGLAAEPVFGTGVAPLSRYRWKFGATFKSRAAALGSRQRDRRCTAIRSAVRRSACNERRRA